MQSALDRANDSKQVTWAMMLDNWDAIRSDLMETFRIIDYQAKDYQWPWFRSIVVSLLEVPTTRIYRRLIGGNQEVNVQ